MIEIGDLLSETVSKEASDLHLAVGSPPLLRVHGKLDTRLSEVPLTSSDLIYLVESILHPSKLEILHTEKDIDAALNAETSSGEQRRFRVNVGYEKGQLYATLRTIAPTIKNLDDIGFPNECYKEILTLRSGLVLVTGTTGSGKTTTLAAIIQEINRYQQKKIITLEDPIEFVHPHLQSLIQQREVYIDVNSFGLGVKYALRQDPDIILVGEIRDKETAEKALEAAETGHLVLATLHTKNTILAAERYINLCEGDKKRTQTVLADNLAYIFSQQLIPYVKGQKERTLAMEIMNVQGSSNIQALLRKGDIGQLTGALQTGRKEDMITMDQHIAELYGKGKVSKEWAISYAHDRNFMRSKLF